MTKGESIVLDAGAFVAYDKGDRRMAALVDAALKDGTHLVTSSAVIAQVWRGSARQARLARLLEAQPLEEESLDGDAARRIGLRCGENGGRDVVDGHIAELAILHDAIVFTSDPSDLINLGVAKDRIVRV